MPREGQSLDDVRKMIESEISAVANGDFDKDNTLIHATVDN